MSLVVSSTTDSQEAVNAAAGIETEAPAEQPSLQREEQAVKAPAPAKPAEPDEAEEETEEEGDGEEEKEGDEPPKPKRTGGFQRKIERLVRENEYLARRFHELAQQQRPQQPPPPQQPQQQPVADGRPRQDQFDSYDEYLDKLTDWKLEARLQQEHAAQAQRHQAAQQQERLTGWQQRVGQFKNEAPDFEDVLESVDHINLQPILQQAIMVDALGPKLAELPAPIVSLRLELVELSDSHGEQLELMQAAGSELQSRLSEGLRQVRASTGSGSVNTVVEVAPWSRIPEARALFVPRDD